MKKFLHHVFIFMALAGCFTLTGCFKNFYTVKTNTGYENLENTMSDKRKEIIVHYTDQTVAIKSPESGADKITGTIYTYLPAKPEYAEPNEGRRLQPYKYKHRETLFREVHVYANIPRPYNTNIATVTKEQVVKYNTYKPAKGASIGSHVLGVVIIAATITVIGAAAAAAIMLNPISISFVM